MLTSSSIRQMFHASSLICYKMISFVRKLCGLMQIPSNVSVDASYHFNIQNQKTIQEYHQTFKRGTVPYVNLCFKQNFDDVKTSKLNMHNIS